MANLESLQIDSCLNVIEEPDQPLSRNEIIEKLKLYLGKNIGFSKFDNHNIITYKNASKSYILLPLAITYLGGNGQHPIWKKRIQLQSWFKEIYLYYKNNPNLNMEVKFIGVYHCNGNVIFVDFHPETYVKKKMHNSSAHVYINDLYQAMKNGIFTRTDMKGNSFTSIKATKLKDYLDNNYQESNLLQLFEKFNEQDEFKKWIKGKDAIMEMKTNGWNEWKQTEWGGWYLEYLFDSYIKNNHLENQALYIGSSNKKDGDLDFDIFFPKDNFYGDLKASDINKKEAPGNDKLNTYESINKYDRLWYVIYEHDTKKDKYHDYETTLFRTHYILDNNEWDKNKPFDPYSYKSRMKHSIKFKHMMIIELNRSNMHQVLKDFNQGQQPDGKERKVKFIINKRNIDNFIILNKTL